MARQHSGFDYEKAAQKKNLPIRQGKGDHVIVYTPDKTECICVPLHRQLANGTECKIKKFFALKLGILLVLGCMSCLVLAYLCQF
jgi:hypothetical protein